MWETAPQPLHAGKLSAQLTFDVTLVCGADLSPHLSVHLQAHVPARRETNTNTPRRVVPPLFTAGRPQLVPGVSSEGTPAPAPGGVTGEMGAGELRQRALRLRRQAG